MRWSLGLLPLFLPALASAQVLITEFQNDPTSTNDDGEWVELQNLGTSSVSLAGWSISDFTGTAAGGEVATRWTFPSGAGLAAGQVIVVAKFASGPGYADNTPAGAFAMRASYECATAAHDDALVPNLTPVGGTAGIALSNSATGDALVLRDAQGNLVAGVEYGTVDRNVPGSPAIAGGSATSLRRVANTGSTLIDFAVATAPDPFVGFTVGTRTPPAITNAGSTPRHLAHGALLTVSATITDADGVASARVYASTATGARGNAAGVYTATPMAAMGRVYSAAPAFGLPTTSPATFHDRYVRYWIQAEDTATATASDPVGATTAASNGAFVWRNVMPAAVSPLADVRAQSGTSLLYGQHSARVEGVVLTRRSAFVANRTNFFIHEVGSNDAIRVFASELIAADVMPGDLVRVTGMIDTFNGVRQIGEPAIDVQVIGSGTAPISDRTIADILANGEQLESQLIRIRGVTLSPAITTWPSNGNATIDDGTGTLTVRVVSAVDLAGSMAPVGSFDIVGILSQFAANNVGGYQLQPRSLADVSIPMVVDAGVIDSGTPVDAGDMADSGVVVNDDAAAPEDAAPQLDAGSEPDAAEPVDAQANADAEVLADAAAPGADAAAPAPDAAAPGADAAASVDATAGRSDATTARADASSTLGRQDDGGCGCDTTQSQSSGASSAGLVLGLVALAVLRRRRR